LLGYSLAFLNGVSQSGQVGISSPAFSHTCGRHAIGPARQAPFPKEITRSQNRHYGFFAGLMDHRKPHTAFLNVHDILRGIALREDGFFSSKFIYLSPQTGRVEK
jgi:hypothetical protein